MKVICTSLASYIIKWEMHLEIILVLAQADLSPVSLPQVPSVPVAFNHTGACS